jgi:branched-chain amino acid transport system substrate-binding protein
MGIASDEDTPARKFYEKLKADYKMTAPWNVLTLMGMAQGLYTVRAIEHAIKKHGAQNLTGAKIRDTLFTDVITTEETFGTLPTLKFTKEAPFPVEGLKVNIATVKGGKYGTAATNVDVPPIKKW